MKLVRPLSACAIFCGRGAGRPGNFAPFRWFTDQGCFDRLSARLRKIGEGCVMDGDGQSWTVFVGGLGATLLSYRSAFRRDSCRVPTDKGYLRRIQLPERRLAAAHRCGCRKVRGHTGRQAGGLHRRMPSRPSIHDQCPPNTNSAVEFGILKALGTSDGLPYRFTVIVAGVRDEAVEVQRRLSQLQTPPSIRARCDGWWVLNY